MAKQKETEVMEEQTTEVTRVETTELTPILNPTFKVETDPQDMILPFLKVIQSQADEVTPGKDKYNEAVRPGNIYDATTRTIYKDPEIIICGIKKYYGEWEGSVRGKLLAKHKVDSDIMKNAVKVQNTSAKGTPYYTYKTKDEHELIETFGVVCIVKNNGISIPATFTLSKSTFAIGKTLNTLVTMYQTQGVPIFKFSTNTKTNNKGSWFVPVFEMTGFEKDANVVTMAANISAVAEQIIFSRNQEESEEFVPATTDDIV